jgi:hypothetical protein
MKYALVREDGLTEIREDNYSLPDNAIALTDLQYDQLTSGNYILRNGQIVANSNPPRNP